MKSPFLKILALYLLVTLSVSAITFNVSQNNKQGNASIYNTPCNKDTQIDFFFASDSKLSCVTGSCATTNLQSSTMKFFDINGNDLVLSLRDAQAVNSAGFILAGLPSGIVIDHHYLFRFANSQLSNFVYVAVPVTKSAASAIFNPMIINVENYTQTGMFSDFKGTQTNLSLSMFNYLNSPDYNRFYHATNNAKTQTLLVSSAILRIPNAISSPASLSSSLAFVPDYAVSGNKLCYASNQSSGLFQTHLRESWPLWTWMIAIMLYWLYYLLADGQTNSCYDKKFEQNKMTCWGFYSLHFLGHVQYFSRLSRLSLLFFVFSFQAVVLSAIYQTRGMDKAPYTNYELIIWTALIALAASLPIPFILGGIFLRNIYNLTIQKFRSIKKTRGMMLNKSSQEQALVESEVDTLQQKLYSYYYIYYVIIFIGMVCFWVPSIYMMMQINRNWYYLQRIWLASLAITFVLDNLIFDPILSLLLGNTNFYRSRGYFYKFQLGQLYKDIQQ